MRFIDTHCHFDFSPLIDETESTLAKAAEAGIEKIIVPAVDIGRFELICQLAADHPALYAALGLHPIAIEDHQEEHLDRLEGWLRQKPKKLVAIGEIGLDLYRDNPHFEKQEQWLDAQLRLAKNMICR